MSIAHAVAAGAFLGVGLLSCGLGIYSAGYTAAQVDFSRDVIRPWLDRQKAAVRQRDDQQLVLKEYDAVWADYRSLNDPLSRLVARMDSSVVRLTSRRADRRKR